MRTHIPCKEAIYPNVRKIRIRFSHREAIIECEEDEDPLSSQRSNLPNVRKMRTHLSCREAIIECEEDEDPLYCREAIIWMWGRWGPTFLFLNKDHLKIMNVKNMPILASRCRIESEDLVGGLWIFSVQVAMQWCFPSLIMSPTPTVRLTDQHAAPSALFLLNSKVI